MFIKNRLRGLPLYFFLAGFLLFVKNGNTAQSSDSLSDQQRKSIIEEISVRLNELYIFAEKAKKMGDHVRRQLLTGAYDTKSDPQEFANAILHDLRSIGNDKHLYFHYDAAFARDARLRQSKNEAEAKQAREMAIAAARRINFGVQKVEKLSGNVGYLDLRFFTKADVGAETATAALNLLAHCDAVIIDLRANIGGDPSGIQYISSYFFSTPTHLNDIYTRSTNTTQNFWTLPFVPGRKLEKADLYILIGKETFSAAEEFAYNMKNLKRAILLGETTGGGAHPSQDVVIQEHFVLSIPYQRAINPITKTNWEETGVSPDVSVPADKAFDTAYFMALENLSQKTTDQAARRELVWLAEAMKAKLNPRKMDEETLRKYVGVYGERKVTLENGQLFYQRTGPKYRLLPLNDTTFVAEGLENYRFEFVLKDGKAIEIAGLTLDGHRDASARTN